MREREEMQHCDRDTGPSAADQQFRAVFEGALDGVLIADGERRYVEANPAAAALFGLSREELTGRQIDEFIDPAKRVALDEGWKRFLSREGGTGEYDVRRHDGSVRTVEYYARPNVAPGRHLCIIRDVTEKKRVREALRESEARLRLALDGARVCAWDWDIASDRIDWWGSIEQLVEIGQAPASVGAVLDLVHPEDRATVKGAVTAAVEQGAPIDVEFRIRLTDGASRWVLAKGHVVHDAAGAAVRVLGVALDIDRHKRTDEEQARLFVLEHEARSAAEAAEERSAFLARASALLAGSLDYRDTLRRIASLAVPHIADWCIIDMTEGDGTLRRLAVAHGDPAKAALASEVERCHPADLHAAFGPARVVRSGEAEVVYDDRTLDAVASGSEHLGLLRRLGLKSSMCVPIAVRGRPCGAISFVSAESGRCYGAADLVLAQELSARVSLAIDNARLLQEAQGANRIKDEFLAMVSHELRGPLQTIVMWTHVLRKDNLDEVTRLRALAGIQQSAGMQRRLVNDLVDVSRIVAGKLTLDLEPVDAAAVVESVVDIIRPGAESKDVTLDVQLDRGRCRVVADPDRLQQVTWNLVSNALKFTPAGGRVAVRVRRGSRQVEIVVNDTGDGIAPELLSHVFEPFRQADAPRGASRAGLGLGLTIVRHLVERHGGTVQAESPGIRQGATFTVRLPLDGAIDDGEGEAAPADPTELDGVRVLLVDDQAPEREALSSVLERCHAHVTAVASAAEAMDAIDRSPLDVLVSDIAMPGEDGYALIRQVRARGPHQGGGIPAAAITAHAGEENRSRALREGFQVYLSKPVSPAELAAIIRSLSGSSHDGRSR